MVIMINNPVLNVHKRVDLKCSQLEKLCDMVEMLINVMVVTIFQCILVSN